MASPTRQGRGLRAEINVTPLVDVVLVLLIIFIVVTPMLTRGKHVELPGAIAAETDHEQPDSLVLAVSHDKRIWLENRPITSVELAAALRSKLGSDGERSVVIKADSRVSVRDLQPLLHGLKRAGVKRIAFAVLEKKEPQKP